MLKKKKVPEITQNKTGECCGSKMGTKSLSGNLALYINTDSPIKFETEKKMRKISREFQF